MEGDQAWDRYRYAVVDLEGSGAQDREKEQILSIAIVTISRGKVHTADPFYSLVKPEYPIKRLPWLKHNITNNMVEDAPKFAEIAPAVAERLRHTVFVAHNARVDWKLLTRYIPDPEVQALLDTLKMSRKLNPALTQHRLPDVVRHYGLEETVKELGGEAEHHALHDAVGAALAFVRMAAEFRSGKATLSELKRLCGIENDDVVQELLL